MWNARVRRENVVWQVDKKKKNQSSHGLAGIEKGCMIITNTKNLFKIVVSANKWPVWQERASKSSSDQIIQFSPLSSRRARVWRLITREDPIRADDALLRSEDGKRSFLHYMIRLFSAKYSIIQTRVDIHIVDSKNICCRIPLGVVGWTPPIIDTLIIHLWYK